MIIKSLLVTSVAGTLLSLSVNAAQPTDMDGANTPNGKVAVAFIDTLFNQHKGAEAFDKYVSHDYIEHGYLGMKAGPRPPEAGGAAEQKAAPPAADTKQSDFEKNRQQEAATIGKMTKMHIDIKKVVVQNDLVFVQGLGVTGMPGNGDLMWILYRVKDGKILEHWDTHNPIPDDQVNKQW